MKILIYNTREQYALSRAEIEEIFKTLPDESCSKIKEFHVTHSHPKQCETFEFDVQSGIAYLIAQVKEKTPTVRNEALRHLLVGLARIMADSKFFHPLNLREKEGYADFVSKWAPKCEAALARLNAKH